MSTEVLAVVLLAALLHAAWNAGVKLGIRQRLPSAAIFIGAGVVATPFLFWVPPPPPASHGWLAGSVAVHYFYSILLGRVYRAGDFSRTYPLMRGVPPLLTVILVGQFSTEVMTSMQQVGVLVLCLGVLSLIFESGFPRLGWGSSAGWALLVAFVIALYTTVDGFGARSSEHAWSYVLWLCALEALVLSIHVVTTQGVGMMGTILWNWRLTLVGGATTLVGYGLVLWAMTQAPIALVAAVREISVIFALLIGAIVFKEKLTAVRVGSIALVVTGVAVIRLA